MKCMNEKSECYAEDTTPSDTCKEWEDRRADHEDN